MVQVRTLQRQQTHGTQLDTTLDYPSSDLPLEVGEHVYLKLEAFPMDFGGATKDCTFFSNNDSASMVDGYHTYTRQIITLSADMVLDGCSVHLQGTSLRINRTAATTQPSLCSTEQSCSSVSTMVTLVQSVHSRVLIHGLWILQMVASSPSMQVPFVT